MIRIEVSEKKKNKKTRLLLNIAYSLLGKTEYNGTNKKERKHNKQKRKVSLRSFGKLEDWLFNYESNDIFVLNIKATGN